MAQQTCWDQSPNCNNGSFVPGYEVPSYPSPGYTDPGYSGSDSLPPSVFMFFLIAVVLWVCRPGPPKPAPQTDEEKMFQAIGKYEGNRKENDKRRTQFIYTFKDPCVDECPPEPPKEDEKKCC